MFFSKKKEDLIFVLEGGLGSQLFQFFAGIDYSLQHNRRVKFDFSIIDQRKQHIGDLRDFEFGVLENVFEFMDVNPDMTNYRKASKLSLLNQYLNADQFYKSRVSGYDVGFCETKKLRIIKGTFNCINHINSVENLLRISIKDQIKIKRESVRLTQQDMAERDSIILHVRRGDYIGKQNVFGLLSDKYYIQAVLLLASGLGKREVFLSSDSPSQVNGLISDLAKYDLKVRFLSQKLGTVETLVSMSQGSAHVISNSSFGWWGAFLSQRSSSVIYPSPWFRKSAVEPLNLNPPRSHWKPQASEWVVTN
jgi:hypothetical protein